MIFQYIPTNELIVDGVALRLLEERGSVRKKLRVNYKEDNQTIDLGDNQDPIVQRRDIYQNINNSENYFFLNYDQDDKLRDIEIHLCSQIKIFDVIFSFQEDVDAIAKKLLRYSEHYKKSEDEYFFVDLKIAIVSKAGMGGEGNTLGYFYCTCDITHLDNNG